MNHKYDLKSILQESYRKGTAIPAFNCFDVFDAKVMVEAAEEKNTPLLLMIFAPLLGILDAKVWVNMVEALAERASVPVFIHLDHCSSVELCRHAIDMGFDSVMIDASADSLDENIRKTLLVKEYAEKHGVIVEAEMGHIKTGKESLENLGNGEDEDYLVQTEDAKALVNATNVDMLAIGIGNQHGIYTGEPRIHFDRLSEVNNALRIPLVLHGGSGLSQDIVRRVVSGGITKINVGTDIALAYGRQLRRELDEQGENPKFYVSVRPAMKAAKSVAMNWIDICTGKDKMK